VGLTARRFAGCRERVQEKKSTSRCPILSRRVLGQSKQNYTQDCPVIYHGDTLPPVRHCFVTQWTHAQIEFPASSETRTLLHKPTKKVQHERQHQPRRVVAFLLEGLPHQASRRVRRPRCRQEVTLKAQPPPTYSHPNRDLASTSLPR
jgi:hypothetical protein